VDKESNPHYGTYTDENGVLRKEYAGRSREKKLLARLVIYGFVLMFLSSMLFFSYVEMKGKLTGFATKTTTFTDYVNTETSESMHYSWIPSETGNLSSLKISGEFTGEGNSGVNVYLQAGDSSYLIYSGNIEVVSNAITGRAIEESNESEKPIEQLNESDFSGESNETDESNESDSTEETTGDITEEKAIEETVIEVPINTSLEIHTACVETCKLSNLNEDEYTLAIEISGSGVLRIDSITYDISEAYLISEELIIEEEPLLEEKPIIENKTEEITIYTLAASGSPGAEPSFFMSSESYHSTDKEISATDFEECPIVLNDYGQTSEKCRSWDCTGWSTSVVKYNKYCAGGWNCTSWNGVICSQYKCEGWTENAVNDRQMFYCSGFWNCINWNGNICRNWNCTSFAQSPTNDWEYYCPTLNCTHQVNGICAQWNCSRGWQTPGNTAIRTDEYCSGVWDCTSWTGATCLNWNCTNWTNNGDGVKFDRYCANGWNCSAWNGNYCDKWQCLNSTNGAATYRDYFCDNWNCSVWDVSKNVCQTWNCNNWTYSTRLDSYCSGVYNCTSWNSVDYSPPSITVLSPLNQSCPTNTIYFNATANEVISKWIVNYNGTNTTLSAINTTLNVSEGSYHLLLYANDTSGNWGLNDSIYFSVKLCAPSFANTTWSNWSNLSCSDSQMNQSRNRTQYDLNNCGWANMTFYDYQLTGPTYLNMSWSSWHDITGCRTNDTILQEQNRTQYDIYHCAANITFYNYTEAVCNYCNYSVTNITRIWQDQTACRANDTILQNRSIIEYDSNYSTCYLVTSRPDDLWNSGNNNTYWEYRETPCNYCNYNVKNITGSWQNQTSCRINDTILQNRSTIEYDSNYSTCYLITTLPSDLWNSGNNNTYWEYRETPCNYCNYSVTNLTGSQANQTSCRANNTILANRSTTEYDSNYSTCYLVTSRPDDLWNSGNNNTYWEYGELDCDYDGAPNITVIQPINSTIYNNAMQLLNINVQDSDIRDIWYNWNGTNITYTAPIYVTFAEGINYLYVYANDSARNMRRISLSFIINTAPSGGGAGGEEAGGAPGEAEITTGTLPGISLNSLTNQGRVLTIRNTFGDLTDVTIDIVVPKPDIYPKEIHQYPLLGWWPWLSNLIGGLGVSGNADYEAVIQIPPVHYDEIKANEDIDVPLDFMAPIYKNTQQTITIIIFSQGNRIAQYSVPVDLSLDKKFITFINSDGSNKKTLFIFYDNTGQAEKKAVIEMEINKERKTFLVDQFGPYTFKANDYLFVAQEYSLSKSLASEKGLILRLKLVEGGRVLEETESRLT
jgi:hypothetical protein